MSQARMMTMTFISEKYDGTLILGRGIPPDWFDKGEVGVKNYKLSDTSRFAYSITPTGNAQEYELTYSGKPQGPVAINLISFLSRTPRVVAFSGAPDNYTTRVTLRDYDSDGKNEIVIDPGYSGSKVVFSMADPSATTGKLSNRFRAKQTGIVYHPVTKSLTIASGLKSSFALSVVNINGKKLVSQSGSGAVLNINLQPVAKGVYFVKITGSGRELSQKIVVR
jgi:hypothetical protein